MADQGKTVYIASEGDIFAVPEEEAGQYIDAGFPILSDQEVTNRLAIKDAEESGVLGAFGKSALASATYSLSDLAYSDEEIAARNDLYPISTALGSIAGAIPAIALAAKTGGAAPVAAGVAAKTGAKEVGRKAIAALAAPGAVPGRLAAEKAAAAGLSKTAQGLSALGAASFVEGGIYSGVESATRQIKNMGIERVTDDLLSYAGETLSSTLYGGVTGVLGAGFVTGGVKGAGFLARHYDKDGKGRERLARFMLNKVGDEQAREASFNLAMRYADQVDGLRDSLFRLKDVEDQLRNRVDLRDDAVEALNRERESLTASVDEYTRTLRENKEGLAAARELEADAFADLDKAAREEFEANAARAGRAVNDVANALEDATDLLGERKLRDTVGKPIKGETGETEFIDAPGKGTERRSPRIRIQEAILSQPGELADNPALKGQLESSLGSLASRILNQTKKAFGSVPAEVQIAVRKLEEAKDVITKKTERYDDSLYDTAEIVEPLSKRQATQIVNDVREAQRVLSEYAYRRDLPFSQQAIDQSKLRELARDVGDVLKDPKRVGKRFAANERQVMNAISLKQSAVTPAAAKPGPVKKVIGKSPRRDQAEISEKTVLSSYKSRVIDEEGVPTPRAEAAVLELLSNSRSVITALELLLEDVKYLPKDQQAKVTSQIQGQIDKLSKANLELGRSNRETLAFKAASDDLNAISGRRQPDRDVRGQKIDRALFRARLEKESEALIEAAESIAQGKETQAVFTRLKNRAAQDAEYVQSQIDAVGKRAQDEAAVLEASAKIPAPPSIGQRAASALKTGVEATAGAMVAGGAGAGFVAGMRRKQITGALGALIPSIRKEDPLKALARTASVISVADQVSKKITKFSKDFTANMARVQPTTRVFDRRIQRSALAKVLGGSVLRQKTLDDIPTDEEVTAMIDSIDEQSRDMEKTLEEIQPSGADPELVNQMQRRVVSTNRYLQDNKPKPATGGPFARTAPRYSLADRKRMATISNVINDPMNTFYANLDANTLDAKTLETLEAIYPDLATRLQTALMEGVAESKTPVPYSKRVMFGRLYGDYFEPTTNTNNIQMLQLNPGSQQGEDQDKLNAAPLTQLPAAQPSAIDRVSGN
jgi:hypothetical protein